MLSTNLILAGILAASLASADVPLSAQHDATYSLVESIGIPSTRNLRAMTKQTALYGTTWTPQKEHYATSTPTYYKKPSNADASWCDSISGDGDAQADNGNQLLSIGLFVSIGPDSVKTCCYKCVDIGVCLAFSFQPLLVTDVCVMARLNDGTAEDLSDSLLNLNANAVVNL